MIAGTLSGTFIGQTSIGSVPSLVSVSRSESETRNSLEELC